MSRMLRRGVLVCLMVCAMPIGVGAQQAVIAALVFDEVTVVDVEQGKLVPGQRVVIQGNRIEAVGNATSVKVPKGAQVVNVRGKYLIPGLWDMHAHPDLSGYIADRLYLANGVTGFRAAQTHQSLDTLIQRRRDILAGTRIGPPRQIFSSQSINDKIAQGPCTANLFPPGYSYSGRCFATPAEIRHAVDSFKNAGADMIKAYSLSPAMYFELAREARRVGIQFGGHLDNVSPMDAADSGAKVFDHVTPLRHLKSCIGMEAVVDKCRLVADRIRRQAAAFVPTLRVNLAISEFSADEITALNRLRTRFDSVMDQLQAGVLPRGNWLRDAVQVDATQSFRFFSVAQQAGLPVLAGSDGRSGFDLHEELAAYVILGMTPLNALRAATLNPSRLNLLSANDSLGTIAPGKLADLVLLDADPLADITNLTTVRAVVANGRYFDRAALDRLLSEARTQATAVP